MVVKKVPKSYVYLAFGAGALVGVIAGVALTSNTTYDGMSGSSVPTGAIVSPSEDGSKYTHNMVIQYGAGDEDQLLRSTDGTNYQNFDEISRSTKEDIINGVRQQKTLDDVLNSD
jgi:hypothetical protein